MTSRLIFSLLIFYRKLIIPSLVTALLTGYTQYHEASNFPWSLVASSYLPVSLAFHFFIYEIRNPGEYYFYHNLGLSKPAMWGTTLLFSSLISCLLLILGPLCT